MVSFVDRRLNPGNKSLGNRRRFIRRVRAHVKKAVDDAVRQRSITEVEKGERVPVPGDSIMEPQFRHAAEGGRRERVLPGNKSFRAGDQIEKPKTGGGGSDREGAPFGEGEDDFSFVLSRDEFLSLFFDDLELPDLVKRSLQNTDTAKPRRAGLSVTGSPANLNVTRTMRNALGRRIALRRPSDETLDDLRARLDALEAIPEPSAEERKEIDTLRSEIDRLRRRQKMIAYVDPLDVRYSYFEQRPEPASSAVMFCLMDVSASMGEREKDLAKRFFILLHLFLTRNYDRVDLVFIRHTHEAQEVDEETFFHSRETGGTVVSTALDEMNRVVAERYPPSEWNIYVAQASDGDNYSGDSARCAEILNSRTMKLCQYFAYVEILDQAEQQFVRSERNGTELWRAYRGVADTWPNLAMKRITSRADIYPVFRELFARGSKVADHG